jgi:putative long chain acyl-CoA synthase
MPMANLTRSGRGRAPESPLRRLGKAAQNALELMRVGRLTSPYGAPFDVVHEDRIYKLRRYQGASARRESEAPPLVLVPPLMVASEVYDIAPEISAVAYLVREGVDVWLVDFGAPERQAGGMNRTLDDHVRAVSDAIDRVRAGRGRDLHLAGYSQGGMFAYQAAAFRRGAGLASVITFGSPVDIHQNVPTWSDAVAERLIGVLRGALALPLEHTSGLPGFLTSTGFKLLSARKEALQMVEFVAKLHDREALERREAKRLFLRGQGFVAWPGPALRKFVDEMIVANRMAVGGFVIDGRPTTLADVRCPILCFVGERDEMARPQSVRAIRAAAPHADVHEVAVKAGHFGLVVGKTALERTWPTVLEWLLWRDAGATGPMPRALELGAVRPGGDGGRGAAGLPDADGADAALADLQFDFELVADVARKAAGALRDRVSDRLHDLSQALDHLRVQVPRFERLRQMTADTEVSIGRELAAQAARVPDGTFFLWKGRAFTYADADARVNHVVRGLVECGLRPGQQVGLLMAGRPSALTMITALSRLGAVCVLQNPGMSDAELSRGLDSVELVALVTDPEHVDRARRLFAGAVLVLGGGGPATQVGGARRALPNGVVDMEMINPEAVKLPAWYLPNPGRAQDLAMIILSVGRSGEPRAARITNGRWAFSALGAAASCTLTSADTVYCCLPLHHAAGSMVAAGSALVAGARLALAPGLDPIEFWSEVRRYGATVVFYAGEMCRRLVDEPHARGEQNHPVRLFAGSGMRSDVWQRLLARFGRVGIMEFYAATETNAVLANASGEKVGAVGRPIPGSSELAVVEWDPWTRTLRRNRDGYCVRVEPGGEGMLLLRTPGPAASAPLTQVVRGAFAPGDAWTVSGDLLRVDADGDHFFVERAADLIRAPGGVVAPARVEDALYGVPGVALAVCWGEASPGSAPGDQIPVAAVVMVPGQTLDPAAVERALAALPLQARPARIEVVAREQVPMTDGHRPIRALMRSRRSGVVGLGGVSSERPAARVAAGEEAGERERADYLRS